ncbi:MAG TPA: hypothetical protein VGH25_13320 [Dongiaceae bacterium]
MSDDPDELLAIVEHMSASLSAIRELVRQQEERLSRLEGSLLTVSGAARAMQDRLATMEASHTGSGQGSFAWALVNLRHGQAMRRARWTDATRVEAFEWQHFLTTCPDEDLVATDWLRA